jgi:hypothetical protein
MLSSLEYALRELQTNREWIHRIKFAIQLETNGAAINCLYLILHKRTELSKLADASI